MELLYDLPNKYKIYRQATNLDEGEFYLCHEDNVIFTSNLIDDTFIEYGIRIGHYVKSEEVEDKFLVF